MVRRGFSATWSFEAVAVEQSRRAACELEDHVAGILSGDHRIRAPQPRRDGLDFAHQITERVDQMDRGLDDEKARHALEVRLPVEVGARPLPVARTQPERDRVQRTQNAGVHQPLRLAVPWLEAEILVHDERHAGALGDAHDVHGIGVVRAKRLLADRGDPARRRGAHILVVRDR